MSSNRILIDTSILVEYIKKTKRDLLEKLLSDSDSECLINETVVSEFLFQFVKVETNKAPLTVQSSGGLPAIIQANPYNVLISLFHFLPNDKSLYSLVNGFMIRYNLLPNDAIMLATCKTHGIIQLASHDSDFIVPCRQENIELLTEEQFQV